MPNPKLDRAVALYKDVNEKEKQFEAVSISLRKAIVDLTNQDFVEYMKLTISDKITVENEVGECKKEQ